MLLALGSVDSHPGQVQPAVASRSQLRARNVRGSGQERPQAPLPLPTLLSTYLLLAIGLKGGAALAKADARELALPAVATLAIGCLIPAVTFFVLRRVARMPTSAAAAMAAFYGSVSAVTFTAAMTFMERGDYPVEGFMASLLAILEIPGIIVALLLAARYSANTKLRPALHEVLTGRSILLLGGGLVIGTLSGADGAERIAPFFVTPFQGILVLFLLDLGARAGDGLGELRRSGPAVITFALAAPLVFGPLGVAVGSLAGLGVGGAAVFGAMTAKRVLQRRPGGRTRCPPRRRHRRAPHRGARHHLPIQPRHRHPPVPRDRQASRLKPAATQ